MPPPSAFDDGPHTQVFSAAGFSSRPRGPSIPPVSECTCRSAELASSAGPELSLSLPELCALACRNADSDPRDVSHCRLVSPFGFSPSSSGLPFETALTGSLPPPVPPFGFSPPRLMGCHCTWLLSVRLALMFLVAPDAARAQVGKVRGAHVSPVTVTGCAPMRPQLALG